MPVAVGHLAHDLGIALFPDSPPFVRCALDVESEELLQERKIERLGSSLPIKVDIRVICATNKDLQKQVEQNDGSHQLLDAAGVLSRPRPWPVAFRCRAR